MTSNRMPVRLRLTTAPRRSLRSSSALDTFSSASSSLLSPPPTPRSPPGSSLPAHLRKQHWLRALGRQKIYFSFQLTT